MVYWGPVAGAEEAALAAVLHGDGDPEGGSRFERARARFEAAGASTPPFAALRDDIDALVAASQHAGQPTVAWAVAPTDPVFPAAAQDAAPPDLAVRDFARAPLDRQWRRWSYTTLARGVDADQHGPVPVAAPPHLEARDDDPDAPPTPGEAPPAPMAAGPLQDLPGGTDVGRYVHGVLERLDFRTLCEKAPPGRPLPELAAHLARRAGLDDGPWPARLSAALPDVLVTPLGAALCDARLADLGPDRRLDEWAFDLPLAGGGAWRPGLPAIDGRDLARCMALRAPDEVLRAPYLGRLAAGGWSPLCGFLTGTIDLATRLPTPDGPRWFVLDYKTNRLEHYGFEALNAEMERHHYLLQAHLYLVALHRYLKRRVPGYDYDRDVGGSVYLFVRGLCGAGTPRDARGRVQGVHVDRPPADVVEGLSRLFLSVGEAP